MLSQVVIENGQKKIQPLTADTGAGNPVGSYLYLEKKSNPQGYLYCDGSTFDETVYPALYQYLGTNVLPDWRELGAKGAEKNTTLIFDSTETDPSTGQAGTQNHDVYAQGEFKDDQLQDHQHEIGNDNPSGQNVGSVNGWFQSGTIRTGNVEKARKGTVTRGKSRAVFIYIKATSGLSENAQDNVINTLNEERSYSTEEVNTGKKWIDGKPIYRKVLTTTSAINTDSFYWGGLETEVQNMNVSSVIDVRGIDSISSRPMAFSSSAGFSTFSTGLAQGGKIILEYTKTN